MEEPTPDPTAIDSAAIQATLAKMETLLAQGKKAIADVEAHYQKHGITEGMGIEFLLGDSSAPWSRELFTRLLQLAQNTDDIIQALDHQTAESAKSIKPAGVKAVGSRYRI